ncbi:LysR family transcriptional regulator [Flammeovirga sp. EKP202]|uniref:LysR family transcriptional regulator n=1 Tax=Flammeovirga sp. EKP202 TaxID=2770592 RepID=UPI00165F3263|nr:LysR family transcriptional regulator [Flammeovirga sp. EKP202]MBD0405110.1 LysR family transcriptional regulator [Flammeovirga sp. EKP202]
MNLQFVKYFVALANTLNFTKASEQVFVVQSTFSSGIKKLEEHFGVKLFERDKRNVKLTQEGEAFLPKAMELLKLWNDIEIGFQVKENEPILISFVQNILLDAILESINQYKVAYPFSEVNIVEKKDAELLHLLLNEQLDVLFVDYEIEHENIDFQFITIEKLVFAINEKHPLSNKKSIPLSILKEEPFIERSFCAMYDELTEKLKEINIKPQKVFTAPNNGTVSTLVASGMGISLMPMPTFKTENVVYLPIEDAPITRDIYLAWNKDLVKRKHTVKNFIDACVKNL